MKIKVDAEENEVLRNEIIGLVLKTENFVAQIPDNLLETMRNKMERLRDKRANWPGYMYLQIRKRMKLVTTGNDKLDINNLHSDETLIAFGEKLIELIDFDTEPKQKTIKESTEK